MALQPITDHYVLVAHHPVTIDASGTAWTDPVWWQDLKRHLLYLHDIELVSPVRRVTTASDLDLAQIDAPAGTSLTVTALPSGLDSLVGQVRALPRTLPALWRAAGRAALLQPDNIAWPTGWIGCIAALARSKRLVVTVENAHWRARPGANIVRRVYGSIWETMVRALAKRATIAFYTQPSYLRALPPKRGPGFVMPASWVDDDDLLSPEQAERCWAAKGDRLRLLFAGRLVEAKGVGILLEAIARLREQGCAADIDIIGTGAMHAACVAAAADARSPRVTILDPVPYGPAFFELVRGYHAMIVPLISDEQPRIIPDAYGQAVPVIGSDTDGVRPHVQDGTTGYLVAPGDAAALAGRISALSAFPARLKPLGLAALNHVQGMTHLAMHMRRWEQMAKLG